MAETPSIPLSRAYPVLVVVFIADLMDMLDSTIANLAGPSIRADLGGNETTLQWVLAAYTVTFALGLVTAGRLGDLVGRRRLFLIGMTGFTVSSLACGLAPGVGWLVVARALQGLFGSLMIPQGFALLTVVFPPEKLRHAFVPFGPIMGLASVGWPILAGWLLQLNLFGSQWRSIFLINVPIGVVAGMLGWRFLPRHTGEDRRIGDSDSSTRSTKRWPMYWVRRCSSEAGTNTARDAPRAASSASATGPMFPRA
jgi:MFS family permease